MEKTIPMEDGEWMSKGQALRLGAAVLSGPLIVFPLAHQAHLLPLPDLSGPLWIDAHSLVGEAVIYWPTLMVVTSLFVHRLLSPRSPASDLAFCLPVLLWGVQSAGVLDLAFIYGHWGPRYVLLTSWAVGLTIFLVLGLVLLLSVPSVVMVENGRRVIRVRLRTVALVGVVILTVFCDWVLASTLATEYSVVPALAATSIG